MSKIIVSPSILSADFANLERDIKDLSAVGKLNEFYDFLVYMAARTAQELKYDEISKQVGVSSPTIKSWVSILERSGIIFILHPYYLKVTDRLIKTPKVYFMDTGLVCYLVGWTSPQVAMNGAMNGALFENFVISEVIKSYYNAGHDAQNLYFYRDKDQREIDLVIEKDGVLYPVEIKKSSRPSLDMAKSFAVLNKIPGKTVGTGCILCQCEKKAFLSDTVMALPIEYL